MNKLISPSEDNSKIVAQFLAEQVKQARDIKYPSAEDILGDILK